MSSTEYVKRKEYKPIDFFFRCVTNVKTGKIAFVDVFQILNDRYLGRMNVRNYFFIAENSVRINELNLIALEELKNYHLVMRENFLIPDDLCYALPLTTRFLQSDKDFDILLSTLKAHGYKKSELILCFDASALAALDDEARARCIRLRRSYRICVNGFGDDYNSLDIFAGFAFDYLRAEAAYFDASDKKKRLLNMLIKLCNMNKIKPVIEGADSAAQVTRFKKEGAALMTGKAIGRLSRWVTCDLIGIKEPSGAELEKYTAKLNKQLDAKMKKDEAELESMRVKAVGEAKEELARGGAAPSAPRPLIAKSVYRAQLDRQRAAAKDRKDREKDADSRAMDDYARSAAADMNGGPGIGGAPVLSADKAESEKSAAKASQKASEKKKSAEVEPQSWESLKIGGIGTGRLFDTAGENTAFGGFGVTFKSADAGGSYDDEGRWQDDEGKVYDGYFDDEGRWIDYHYTTPSGETADNGYYDSKIKKWVPYGYFDDDGAFVPIK